MALCCTVAVAQDFDKKMVEYGLVDVRTMDSTIAVHLMYATADNFVGKNMYGTLNKAYMQPEIAKLIVRAQKTLKAKNPDWSLKIMDAARPMSVQRTMFATVAGTPKNIYVANPSKGGGRHNYGTAVDITIIDKNGTELDMGSAVDFLGIESHIDAYDKGLISAKAEQNRRLLIDIMASVGMSVNSREWWHFQKYTMAELKVKYKLLNF